MARAAASIQLEIDRLEAYLASNESLRNSVGSDGVSVSNANREAITKRLDSLYRMLDRLSGAAPMFARGKVRGLEH